MDIADLNTLTEASEAFTPLKLVKPQLFQIAQDPQEDDNGEIDSNLTKIPHGLTAKKNRRKSYHHDSNRNQEFTLTPQRAPLTAPRNNVLNSKPITSSITHAKRLLIDELQSTREGKENAPLASQNHDFKSVDEKIEVQHFKETIKETVITTQEHIITPSSPDRMVQKRRSSTIKETSFLRKLPKFNEEDDLILVTQSSNEKPLIDVQTQGNLDTASHKVEEKDASSTSIEDFESDEEGGEELSRIEPFEIPNDDVNISNLDEIQNDEMLQLSNLATPSRITEPVALSPKTEQCSRVVDESILLLDTTKSPNFDDSYVADSPLSLHNTSLSEKHDADILDNLETIDEEVFGPEKRTQMSTPNQRPFFTISQVHNIQDEFKQEVCKLEDALKSKSVSILGLNNEINQYKNQIFQLQDEIESISLQKKQYVKENQLLESEHDIFKTDIEKLENSFRAQDEKLLRQKTVITKFKEKVKQLDAQLTEKSEQLEVRLKEKSSKLEQLEEDLASKNRAIDILQNRVSDFELHAQTLSNSLRNETEKLSESIKREEALAQAVEESKISYVQSEKIAHELSNQVSEVSSLLHAKELELKDLNIQKEQLSNYLSDGSSENAKLRSEIQNLKTLLQELESSVEAGKTLSSREHDHLKKKFDTIEKSSVLKDVIIKSLRSGVETLKSTLTSFQAQLSEGTEAITSIKQELANTQELLTIRVAEVNELVMKSLQEYIDEVDSKDTKIQKLDEELQKQETDHLTELEAFHSEMSNVQSMFTNKSNELYKLKEENSKVQREYDIVRYEYESLKEEASEFNTRISNLKIRLQDSKSLNKILEGQVKSLTDEKSSLEAETDNRLQQLAEDLYIQYSKKHEQKVQVLKKGYEGKWQSKVTKAESENEKLRREIEGLSSQLEKERVEKNEIIKLWDKFKEAESTASK